MELKKLSVNDREMITELFVSVFTNDPWNDDWSDKNQLDSYITDLTGNPNSLTLGYFSGEKLAGLSIGSIKHWYSGTEYFIDELCIAPEFQRRGIGTAFVNDIRNYLLEMDIHNIYLTTIRNYPAFSFYKKLGFTELEELVPLISCFE